MIIIMRFDENNVLYPKYIDIYEFGVGYGGDVHIPPHIFCLLFKKQKKYKSMTYTKIKFYIISIYIFFPGMNNKKFMKRGPRRPLLFLYEVSIVVLIDFIAILQPPGIFVIQTVNTNMYLIHFHSKTNIQLRFPQSWVFKVSNKSQSLNFYLRKKTKNYSAVNCMHYNVSPPDFQKKQLN